MSGSFTSLEVDGTLFINIAGGPPWTGAANDWGSSLTVNAEPQGTSSGASGAFLNSIYMRDTVHYTGTQAVDGLTIWQDFGGTGPDDNTASGSRQGLQVSLNQVGATTTHADSGRSPFFVGGQFYSVAAFSEGGTVSAPVGQVFGLSSWGRLESGATSYAEVCAYEANISVKVGASVSQKVGIAIVKPAEDQVSGWLGKDAALIICDQVGAAGPWNFGIQFGNGYAQWPFDSNSVLCKADGAGTLSARTAFDLRGVTFTGYYLQFDNYSVDAAGTVSAFGLRTTGARKLQIRTVTASGPVPALDDDDIVVIDKSVGEPTTVNLMTVPGTGRRITIKDGKGDAAINNITLVPAVGLIDGGASLAINRPYGKATLIYSGTRWFTI